MTSHATKVYALGINPAETARLRRQSEELKPEALALLDRLGLSSSGCPTNASSPTSTQPCART